MRIALLSAAKSIHTLKWAAALSARGHRVALYSISAHRTAENSYPPEVEIHYLECGGGAGYWLAAGTLGRMLENFKPDIVNAHYATGYGTLARRCGFGPVFLSVWGSDVYDFPYRNFLCRKILLKNLESAAAIGSTSNAMAGQVHKLYPSTKPVYITPFGVDTQQFQKTGEPRKDVFTIGIVKSLEKKYGVDYLLRSFSLLKTRLQKEGKMPPGGVCLEIYGSGSEEGSLKRLAQELNLADCVHFMGAVPHSQVPAVLSRFSIFCAPSILDSESFGVAAVEAMACEVPVVVSDADGFREVVLDGETGFVVPKRDFVTFGNKLFTLVCDSVLRGRMGAAGRRHVLDCYDWQDNVSVMENALTETALKSKKPDIL